MPDREKLNAWSCKRAASTWLSGIRTPNPQKFYALMTWLKIDFLLQMSQKGIITDLVILGVLVATLFGLFLYYYEGDAPQYTNGASNGLPVVDVISYSASSGLFNFSVNNPGNANVSISSVRLHLATFHAPNSLCVGNFVTVRSGTVDSESYQGLQKHTGATIDYTVIANGATPDFTTTPSPYEITGSFVAT
jgi:hypothetical protein